MAPPIHFAPAHPQPFTLEQAVLLDVNILVAEISRLRNSITHLQKTQEELRSFLAEEPGDRDIALAIEENDDTIASQTERIGLIRVALMNKVGKDALKHYDLGDDVSTGEGADRSTNSASGTTPMRADDGGLHL